MEFNGYDNWKLDCPPSLSDNDMVTVKVVFRDSEDNEHIHYLEMTYGDFDSLSEDDILSMTLEEMDFDPDEECTLVSNNLV